MGNPLVRVVGYIRVSTDAQADSGLSLDAQRAKLTAYAVAMDLDLVAIVEDAGESGKSLDRAGLRSALAMLESGAASGLLIAKLDRLTRKVAHLSHLIDCYFSEKATVRECRLLSVQDSIDTKTAAGRLVLNVLASVGQWEAEVISERTTDALAVLKSRGVKLGRPVKVLDLGLAARMLQDGRSQEDAARELGVAVKTLRGALRRETA